MDSEAEDYIEILEDARDSLDAGHTEAEVRASFEKVAVKFYETRDSLL